MTKVIFSTTGGIGSRLLRVMMASPYSHCGIVAGDDVWLGTPLAMAV